ncbi:MAG: transcriptional regulator, MarR family [Solirubrobacterales bacterium]|jgi:DNA-binding MarR family transcriptional regulator|nr:transcriptional regulator, MarR family [Solirubrobacterales bacterium]
MRTKSSAPPLAAHLRLAVARTARRLRQEAGGGLGPTSTAALATIDRHGPLTPSELAARERIQRPTATRLIANLEADGLVARTADPVDRRSFLIAMTPEGSALLRELRTRKDAFLADRLRRLPAEDRATLRRAAELLEGLLEDEST